MMTWTQIGLWYIGCSLAVLGIFGFVKWLDRSGYLDEFTDEERTGL
jgi:hypothetical protein